jgi:hypothetical protein
MKTTAVKLADRRFRDRARNARSAAAEALVLANEGHRATAHQKRYDLAAPIRAREAAAAALAARKAETDKQNARKPAAPKKPA